MVAPADLAGTPLSTRAHRRPLSTFTSLARNPARTLPMFLAILLATLGICTVVWLTGSVFRTAVAPNDFLRGTLYVQLQNGAPSELRTALNRANESTATQSFSFVRARTAFTRGHVFDFDMWFPILLVDEHDLNGVLSRYGASLVSGRAPQSPSEVVLPRAFARNRGLALGDVIGGPGDFNPLRMSVVGFTDGPLWIGLGSATGIPDALPSVGDGYLIFPTDPTPVALSELEGNLASSLGSSAKLRHWTPDTTGGDRADTTYQGDLQLLLGFVVLVNTAVLALIGGLLGLIYFRSRRSEFVLLFVLGYARLALALRVLWESLLVIGAGWVLGVAAGWMLVQLLSRTMLEERGIIVVFNDMTPLLYSVPLAVCTFLVANAVTALAFARFDPVSALEERA